MWNIWVCDDDIAFQGELKQQVQDIMKAEQTWMPGIVSFCEADELERQIREHCGETNLVFLDLTQDQRKSLLLGKQILDAQLVFLSAEDKRCWEFYDVEHLYALRKPVGKDHLRRAVERAAKHLRDKRVTEFAVVTKKGIERIPMDQILYFEKEKRKVHLYTPTQRCTFYGKFSDVISRTSPCFMRCHNSYVVNIAQMRKLIGRKFFFANGMVVPISQTYYREIRQAYLSYLGCQDEGPQDYVMIEKDDMEE
ncbi:MAG: LytTR family transcriptional regulator [Firmicutes bacterium]|nr:LytTR family transcriptional regulator [Bacillota bacterium]NBI62014.1 hypothetical protein [Clostridiales bacterium]